MDINFEYYKVFYYAARYRNLTRAAAALGSNQPNVTRIIKLLEAQLGCRLFVREPRGIGLTEEGEKLYSHVEAAYDHLIRAQEEIGGHSAQEAGTVEIGATETALHLFLLEEMREFKGNHPKIRMKVHNHSTPEIIKLLIAGRLDFALVTTPVKAPRHFPCETVWRFREILVGGPQYRSLGTAKASLRELAGYPWVGLGRETATYGMYRDFFLEHQAGIEPEMEVATSDLLLPLIQNNLGIGFVPEALAQPLLDRGLLVQIPLDCPPPSRSIQLISDKGRGRSMAADIFYKSLSWKQKAEEKAL